MNKILYSFQLYYFVTSVSQLANSLTIDALQLIAFPSLWQKSLASYSFYYYHMSVQKRGVLSFAVLLFKPLHFYQPFMFPCKCENKLVISILKFLL